MFNVPILQGLEEIRIRLLDSAIIIHLREQTKLI
nr:MAG TPA: hypothetical protein [Caudoviricetes sp.]